MLMAQQKSAPQPNVPVLEWGWQCALVTLTDADGSTGGSAPLVGGPPINSEQKDGSNPAEETPSMGFSPADSYSVLESKLSSSLWEIESRPLTS